MDFDSEIKKNKKAQELSARIRKTGSQKDLRKLAEIAGETAVKTISAEIEKSPAIVDEGYVRNIVSPVLKASHSYIAGITAGAVTVNYRKQGLGLRGIAPEYNSASEDEIVEAILEAQEKELMAQEGGTDNDSRLSE